MGNVVADEVEGQIGGLLDELDGTVDVGQAGKLDEDTVALLLADIRFGDAAGASNDPPTTATSASGSVAMTAQPGANLKFYFNMVKEPFG